VRGWEIVACVAAIVLVVDQLSKTLVLTFLAPGAAFGLFQGKNPLLAFLAFGVVVALVVWFRELVRFWLGALALGLQLGGAVGNLIDRFRHGFVVDFIDFSFWPTFNVADSAITIGVLMLLYVLLRQGQLESPRARGAERIDAEQQIR
jgi:signal peptidase II